MKKSHLKLAAAATVLPLLHPASAKEVMGTSENPNIIVFTTVEIKPGKNNDLLDPKIVVVPPDERHLGGVEDKFRRLIAISGGIPSEEISGPETKEEKPKNNFSPFSYDLSKRAMVSTSNGLINFVGESVTDKNQAQVNVKIKAVGGPEYFEMKCGVQTQKLLPQPALVVRKVMCTVGDIKGLRTGPRLGPS